MSEESLPSAAVDKAIRDMTSLLVRDPRPEPAGMSILPTAQGSGRHTEVTRGAQAVGPMRAVGLVLVDGANEFQQLLAREAAAAAKKAGFAFGMRASGVGGYELGTQLKVIDGWLEEEARPDALLMLAARDRGLSRTIRGAARRGVHWMALNRTEDDLDAVRSEFPGVVVATVCPDEKETGRIQARIVKKLLPDGGRVLNVTGYSRSLTARDRSEGLAEALAGGLHEIVRLEAGWSAAEAHAAVGGWLRIVLRARRRLDGIVCQTDSLAEGTLQALDEVRSELGRQDLEVPVVGCDGTPGHGQALVASGRLAATVILPRAAATAIGLLSGALERGMQVPAFTPLAGRAWPEGVLSPRLLA